ADLIDAFVRVHARHPDARLVLVGGGPLLADMQARVRTHGVQHCVEFTGPVADVASHIRRFSIGVLPSASEGLSTALLEYMACGVPVVASHVGGNAELVDDGATGFLIQP